MLLILSSLIMALFLIFGAAFPAHAKNHLLRCTEFFSNAEGTIQFIEMQECCGSDAEVLMALTSITSNAASFPFPNDLSGPTAFRWIIIATQGFADLPGVPTPDYIMPDGFFDPTGDTLRYRGVTDIVTLEPGALPLDGVNGIDRNLTTGALTVAVNSPINFAGETGSANASPAVPSFGWSARLFVVGICIGFVALLARRQAA